MALSCATPTLTLAGNSTVTAATTGGTGGTGPYTYQWYRSTTTGFTPGAGSLLAGQTALTLADSGLAGATAYYYKVIVTDTGNSNVTATSSQLAVTTEPQQSQNQFAQASLVGLVDMRVGPTNVISAQVDVSVGTATAPLNVIYPGQGVKIVAATTGGIPKVAPVAADSDSCIGFVTYNIKDIQYVAGQNLEVAMWGSVVWCYATGAITQFARACLDVTFVGGVQATGDSATIMGWAFDGASAAGLIRVMLMPNSAFTTA